MIRFLIIILLMSAICSCHSSRQSVTEYVDTSDVAVNISNQTLTNNDVLSLISASSELDLSGIKVEFFPPDSAHPDARAAPKSLTIESAKAKENTEQATHSLSSVNEQLSENISAHSSANIATTTQVDSNILHPSNRVIFCSILVAIILSLSFLIKFYAKK